MPVTAMVGSLFFTLKKAWYGIFFLFLQKQNSIAMNNDKKNAMSKYYQEIGNTPLLTDEQERQLAQRIQDGDPAAISELVEPNLRFVLTIANQYRGHDVAFDDLVSEGNIGLMKAASRYSPYPGKRFVTFAAPIIRDCIERYIDSHTGLYNIPHDELNSAESRRRHPVSVDAPIPAGSNNNFSLLNLLENVDSPYADKNLTQEDVESRIKIIFNQLDERERQVMTLIYGIGTHRHTMAEVGMLLDLKRERVRQIRDKALRKLRKARRLFQEIS